MGYPTGMGKVLGTPGVRDNSSGISLSYCKLDLWKHITAGMEHTPSKEERKLGSWSGISHPQSTSSHLLVLPPSADMYGTYNQVKS